MPEASLSVLDINMRFSKKQSTPILILFVAVMIATLSSCSTTEDTKPSIKPVVKSIKGNFHVQGSNSFPDSLAPVYPNPFNSNLGDSAIHVLFTLNDTAGVKLIIQNPLGDSVAVFKDSVIGPGIYDGYWAPINAEGERLGEGIYFITLRIFERDYINSRLFFIEAN